MIQEAYVSFETAKLLKEKGFKEECYTFYEYNSKGFYREERVSWNTSYSKDCAAPTHQMAMEWLREKYGYHISILWNYEDRTGKEAFIWGINNINNFEDKGYNGIGSNIYGETVEAAIKYVLENLI